MNLVFISTEGMLAYTAANTIIRLTERRTGIPWKWLLRLKLLGELLLQQDSAEVYASSTKMLPPDQVPLAILEDR